MSTHTPTEKKVPPRIEGEPKLLSYLSAQTPAYQTLIFSSRASTFSASSLSAPGVKGERNPASGSRSVQSFSPPCFPLKRPGWPPRRAATAWSKRRNTSKTVCVSPPAPAAVFLLSCGNMRQRNKDKQPSLRQNAAKGAACFVYCFPRSFCTIPPARQAIRNTAPQIAQP